LTHVLHSFHTEKLGVAEVQRICAKARTIFRPIHIDDVGIDGFIELVEDGAATGIIAGIQIKSGESFVDKIGTRFTFKADQEHFGYWARCSFPVIGIVFSPDQEKAVWLDLTSLSTDDRIVKGPYSITVEYSAETAFTPSNVASRIKVIICRYAHQRRTLGQIRELIKPQRQKANLDVPSIEVSSEREQAWYELIEVLLGFSSKDEEVADAGYRLSWYFPAVSINLQQALKERLSQVDDFSLVRILRTLHTLIENNAEPAAELIVDLLSYIPDITRRIETSLKAHRIPSTYVEGAIQTLELIEQKYRDDPRNFLDT
jgi:hypothetical protein